MFAFPFHFEFGGAQVPSGITPQTSIFPHPVTLLKTAVPTSTAICPSPRFFRFHYHGTQQNTGNKSGAWQTHHSVMALRASNQCDRVAESIFPVRSIKMTGQT
jgi:hypothetical protein